MTRNTAETAKTGPRTREQADPAYEDGPNPERPAESRTAPAGATAILRLIAHGRHCGCDLCTTEEASYEA